MKKEVVISIGSNTDDAHAQVLGALNWLANVLSEVHCSSIYTTAALHGGSTYTNAVAIGWSDMELSHLQALLKDYEIDCGRDEAMRAQHLVPIDLDVVIYDSEVLKERDFQQNFFTKGYNELNQL